MEKIVGISLSQFLLNNDFIVPAALCSEIAKQIDALFDLGIIHKDLHAGNIIVAFEHDRWRVKIIDYGKAQLISHSITDDERRKHTVNIIKELKSCQISRN